MRLHANRPLCSAAPQPLLRQPSRAPLRIGRSDDAAERQADRIADAVMAGRRPEAATAAAHAVRRQGPDDPPDTKSNTDKLKEAGEKVAEAALDTPAGKRVIGAITDSAPVEWLTSWPGIMLAGGLAAGAVGALGLTDSELPFQLPAIPAGDFKFKLEWKGPVFAPTSAILTFSGTFGGSFKKRPKAAEPAALDPAHAQALAAERIFPAASFQPKTTLYPDPFGFVKGLPAMKPLQPTDDAPKQFQLEKPSLGDGTGMFRPRPSLRLPGKLEFSLRSFEALDPIGKSIRLRMRNEAEDTPVLQRAGNGPAPQHAPVSVVRVLESPGKPLPKKVRATMEARFGLPFDRLRIHADGAAADASAAINADAFAVGAHIGFAKDRFRPETPSGARLLAHEIAHTVQSGATT